MKTPDDIIAATIEAGRVCPQPDKWDELWNLLPDRRRNGNGWEPSLPLMLAAWHHTSDSDKRDRFLLHLKWAESHGAIESITSFLEALSPSEWHTSSTDH
jgi:hypothetical protein